MMNFTNLKDFLDRPPGGLWTGKKSKFLILTVIGKFIKKHNLILIHNLHI